MGQSWHCPHCNQAVTITNPDKSESKHIGPRETKFGNIVLRSTIIVCPNRSCLKPTVGAVLSPYESNFQGMIYKTAIQSYYLYPDSDAKPMPEYLPSQIAEDYYEASKIKNLSPKASATLARRCLQGMIRDFWKVSGRSLFDEIEKIKDKVDPLTWEAIDSVRKVGNIGAHMEKDINTIIEVDPSEAGILLQLIESLVTDWYVNRFNREETRKKMISIAAEKEAAKKTVTS